MKRAQDLREAGWTLQAIAGLIEREQGLRVSKNTILRWTSPEQAEKQAARVRAAHRLERNERSTGRMPGAGNLTEDWKVIRIKALSDLKLSVRAIAAVMSFDFGEPLSAYQVERILARGTWPRKWERRDPTSLSTSREEPIRAA